MKTVSILGCGWLGMPLGAGLVKSGYGVFGSSRSTMKFDEIASHGMTPFVIDLDELKTSDHKFFESEVLILNVPPSNTDEKNYLTQLRRVDEISEFRNILFVSSTGVYPNLNREVFEEDADESAKSRSGISLLNAEKRFHSEKNTVVRFGGLVDKRRNPGRWFAGRNGIPGGGDPVNMIHLDDCIGAIKAILEKEIWGEVFSVCHPEHPSRSNYYKRITNDLGLQPPNFLEERSDFWKQVSPIKFLERSGYQFQKSIWDV